MRTRGVLERLGEEDASITQLADTFQMTLTGMKKHVSRAGACAARGPEKVGRARPCRVGSAQPALGQRGRVVERYRQHWATRFDELDKVVEESKQKEKADGRKS